MSRSWVCTDLIDLTDAGCDGVRLYLFSERTIRFGFADRVIVRKHPGGSLAGLIVNADRAPEYGVWAEAVRSDGGKDVLRMLDQ